MIDDRCPDCLYYQKIGDSQGVCRRYPPGFIGKDTAWVVVRATDWCGEHVQRLPRQKVAQ